MLYVCAHKLSVSMSVGSPLCGCYALTDCQAGVPCQPNVGLVCSSKLLEHMFICRHCLTNSIVLSISCAATEDVEPKKLSLLCAAVARCVSCFGLAAQHVCVSGSFARVCIARCPAAIVDAACLQASRRTQRSTQHRHCPSAVSAVAVTAMQL